MSNAGGHSLGMQFLQNAKEIFRSEEGARKEEERRLAREAAERMPQGHYETYGYLRDPLSGTGVVPMPDFGQLDEGTQERIKDVRAGLYWIYRPKNVKELKV